MSWISIHEWRLSQLPGIEWLDAEPIRALIAKDGAALMASEGRLERNVFRPAEFPGLQVLAERVGIGERNLRAICNGETKRINVAIADKYLCATGRHLRDVWPAYYGEPA